MWLPLRSSCRLGPGTGGCFAVSPARLVLTCSRSRGSRSAVCVSKALTFRSFSALSEKSFFSALPLPAMMTFDSILPPHAQRRPLSKDKRISTGLSLLSYSIIVAFEALSD